MNRADILSELARVGIAVRARADNAGTKHGAGYWKPCLEECRKAYVAIRDGAEPGPVLATLRWQVPGDDGRRIAAMLEAVSIAKAA